MRREIPSSLAAVVTDFPLARRWSNRTTTVQFPIVVDPPVSPPPPPTGCGVGAHGATASPEYTARVAIPALPDLQLYDFSVSFTYCWTNGVAKVLHVTPFGTVASGKGVAALEALGFTPTFDSSSQFVAGASADATGDFSIRFAAGGFILNLGLGAAAEKLVLEQLVPKLDLLISESASGKRIDDFLTDAVGKVGLRLYKTFLSGSRKLVAHIPGAARERAGRRARFDLPR